MQLNIIPLNQTDRYLIYRPLVRLAFIGNKKMADICERIAQGEVDKEDPNYTKALDFLRSVHFMQEDPPPPPSKTQGEFRPILAVLLMTNRCQLRCIYCYADAGEVPEQDLDAKVGQAAIDIVHENAQQTGAKYFEVSFHGGGEPTLTWEAIKDCTAYARGKPLPARITLTSNGVWSPTQCTWIMENLDRVSLSMDGRQGTQDQQRPFLSGIGSFEIVWRNIQAMDAQGFDYALRLTATAPFENFPKEIEYLCQETACQHFHVEPTFHIQRGMHGDLLPGEGQAFVDAFLEGLSVAEAAGRSLMYSGGRLGLVTDTFCTAPFQALIVNPLGQLVTCYELAGRDHPMNAISVVGSLTPSEMTLDKDQRHRLHGLIAARRDACQDCFCYWSCAGDCYVRALPGPEADVRVRGERCEINRGITLGLLLRQIARGNGVWYAPLNTEVNPANSQGTRILL